MKLQYLGTAAAEGWPGIFCSCPCCERAKELGGKDIRTRSQALVDDTLLLDLPPDTYMHYLQYNFPLPKISSLLVTHSHTDHFCAAALEFHYPPFCNKEAPDFHFYGNESVEEKYRILEAETPGLEEYISFHLALPFQAFSIGKYKITPLPAVHDKRELCLIYLIEDSDKTLLYAHDSGIFSEDVWDFLKGKKLDLVSLDCTCQSQTEGSNHMGLGDNVIVKNRLISQASAGENTVFVANHFSHNGLWDHKTMEEKAGEYGILASFDGMVVEV